MGKRETWKFIIQTLVAILSAIATSFGVASCCCEVSCILCEDVMCDREGVTMDKRTKVKTRSHTPPSLFLFLSFAFPLT